MAVYPYLTFNGNCGEAMQFYQACFGGVLQLRYLGESPQGSTMPLAMQQLIVQASLISEHIRLFASDLGHEEGHYAGNSISLLIGMSRSEMLGEIFNKLAFEGEVTAPLSPGLKKGQWATLTDRYAVQWIFEVQ
ncbi:VOC family protein [Dyadobacter sp. Leaf189]|uniref:VOC family protein n=1 Tax=Dyadobacter sp. Leaf189 TaxID=1736295 RepID=UPI0006FD72E8|nr:VOC family protein [Dyadobacter sp. Leaf189]KQS34377.1 3-demethylubiquinone-9 3-methyltransferase [Dyadobacter sp. Leaf189]